MDGTSTSESDLSASRVPAIAVLLSSECGGKGLRSKHDPYQLNVHMIAFSPSE